MQSLIEKILDEAARCVAANKGHSVGPGRRSVLRTRSCGEPNGLRECVRRRRQIARGIIKIVATPALIFLVAASLASCATGTPSVDSALVESLARDPATACIVVGAVPPYFGGFAYARDVAGRSSVSCGQASIAPASAKSGPP